MPPADDRGPADAAKSLVLSLDNPLQYQGIQRLIGQSLPQPLVLLLETL